MKPMKYIDTGSAVWAEMIEDDAWAAEQKMDGTRGLALVTSDGIDWLGLSHTAATQHFAGIAEGLRGFIDRMEPGDVTYLDGEIMIRTGEYHLFDVPVLGWGGRQVHDETAPLSERRSGLELEVLPYLATTVKVVRQARTTAGKAQLMADAQQAGAEGLVFKRLDAPYRPGVRSGDVRKAKFVKTVDVVVTHVQRGRNSAGREVGSIAFALLNYDGTTALTGSCSVIGKPYVEAGFVIEVAYLYREPGGTLIQPRMTRVRQDKQAHECTIDQVPAYTRDAL